MAGNEPSRFAPSAVADGIAFEDAQRNHGVSYLLCGPVSHSGNGAESTFGKAVIMLRRKNWESRRRLLGALLTLAPFLFAAGCGSSTTTITGKVYYKDKPLPGGSVTFVGPGGKGGGASKISEDG